jgi:hypothetical protein
LGPAGWPGCLAAPAAVNQFVAAVSRGAEPGGALLVASTTPVEQTKRNAGFIRQAGEWGWGCRMNPAFRWCCQDAPSWWSRLRQGLKAARRADRLVAVSWSSNSLEFVYAII